MTNFFWWKGIWKVICCFKIHIYLLNTVKFLRSTLGIGIPYFWADLGSTSNPKFFFYYFRVRIVHWKLFIIIRFEKPKSMVMSCVTQLGISIIQKNYPYHGMYHIKFFKITKKNKFHCIFSLTATWQLSETKSLTAVFFVCWLASFWLRVKAHFNLICLSRHVWYA